MEKVSPFYVSSVIQHSDQFKWYPSAGGYLFAVVDPLDTHVQFGVKISPGGPGRSNISLYFSSPSLHFSSQVVPPPLPPSHQHNNSADCKFMPCRFWPASPCHLSPRGGPASPCESPHQRNRCRNAAGPTWPCSTTAANTAVRSPRGRITSL